MKILFVSPYVPSPVRIRPYAFIRELARRGHEVTLVCLVQPAWEAQYLPDVSVYCHAVHPVFLGRFEPYVRTMLSLPSRTPLSVAYCQSNKFQTLIRDLDRHGNFDLIHTEFLRAAPATIHLTGRPKVYDAVDSLALAYRRSLSAAQVSVKQRAVALAEWVKISRYEPSILGYYDRLLVSSPADQKALGNGHNGNSGHQNGGHRNGGYKNGGYTNGDQRISVIPNGVDLEEFAYQDVPREPETIMFLGKMSYYVNVASILWFYHQVFPLIKKQRPSVKLKIVGRNPVPRISALASDPSVEITGTVPDVRPHLASATLSILPMVSGAGIQNKMLESMAVGTPCVSTSMACDALQVTPGEDVLVADTAADFGRSVLRLLEDAELRRRLSANGRRYVETYHAWDNIGDCLTGVYESLTS